MNAQRARAYRRVIDVVDDPAAMLSASELETVREAADTFVLAQTLNDAVVAAMVTLLGVARELVDSGRWPEGQAEQLVQDAAACAPRAADGRDLKFATQVLRWPEYESR